MLPSSVPLHKFEAIEAEIKDEFKPAAREGLDRWLFRREGLHTDATSCRGESTGDPVVRAHAHRHVVADDTLVESPIVATYVDGILARLQSVLGRLHLPVSNRTTVQRKPSSPATGLR